MIMRGYTLIEPDIHSKLNWDLDLIVKCLEVIRLHMPEIISKDIPGIEYDLIAVGNPHSPPYPAIGMYCPEETDLNSIPDWPQVDDRINQWVQQIGLSVLIEKAYDVKYIDWKGLIRMKAFPNRGK